MKCNLYKKGDVIPQIFSDENRNIIGDGINDINYIENKINNEYVYFDKIYTNNKYTSYFYDKNLNSKSVDVASLGKNALSAITNDIGALISKRDSYIIKNGKPAKLEWKDILIVQMGTNNKSFSSLTALTQFYHQEKKIVEF